MGWLDKAMAFVNPVAAISTAASMGMDYLGMQADERDSKRQMAATERMNAEQMQLARQQIAAQFEMAKHGIRWRVEDAEAAGLHPLAALGASGASYSPVTAVMDTPDVRTGRGNFYRSMGQNLSRAIAATQTAEERALSQLRVRAARADVEMKELELERMRTQVGPGFPGTSTYLDGQGDSSGVDDGRVRDVPLVRTVSDPRNPSKEAGAIPDFQIVRSAKGWAVVPAKDVKERIEDSPMEWQWLIRNAMRPYKMPNGHWGWMNPLTGNLKASRRRWLRSRGQSRSW